MSNEIKEKKTSIELAPGKAINLRNLEGGGFTPTETEEQAHYQNVWDYLEWKDQRRGQQMKDRGWIEPTDTTDGPLPF